VTCEACHGPGREHIAAARRHDRDLKMAHLAGLRAEISIELCGQCHRSPASNRRDDDPMAETQLARLQGFALAQSACFRKSGGNLSCVTCHDPHRDADRTGHAVYDARCQSCHHDPAAHQSVCKAQPQGDCVSCHMPAQEVQLPTRPKFRNHWIRVW
jgi:hypothetical protein